MNLKISNRKKIFLMEQHLLLQEHAGTEQETAHVPTTEEAAALLHEASALIDQGNDKIEAAIAKLKEV